MQSQHDPLLAVEREFLLKQRANTLDQLALIERRLGIPSSVYDKQHRRNQRRSTEEHDYGKPHDG